MMTTRSIITLACGILLVIGVFLPWASATEWGITLSFSGWEMFRLAGIVGEEAWEPLVLLIGGILMGICALLVLIISLGGDRRKAVRNLSVAALTAALVASGIVIYTIIEAVIDDMLGFVAYGFYMCAAAAVLGLIFAVMMLAGSRRQPAAVSREIASSDRTIEEKIKRLAELKEAGVITEEEFEARKSKLLDEL